MIIGNLSARFQKSYSAWRAALYWRKLKRIFRLLHRRTGGKVLFGPFKNMYYPLELHKADRCPMLLGSYEYELHSDIHLLSKRRFTKIIDIGCAEGYYAVGFALLFPSAVVYAFDIDLTQQKACSLFARKNHVHENVKIGGECTQEWLRANVDGNTLIMCDCEGAELDILSPEKVPQLAHATMIVELHDNLFEGLSEKFLPKFRGSHDVKLLVQQTREKLDDYVTKHLSRDELVLAASEYRNGIQTWAVLTPNKCDNH